MAKEKKPKKEPILIKKDVLLKAAPKILSAVELQKLPLSEMIAARDAQEDYARRYQSILPDVHTFDLLKRITQGDIITETKKQSPTGAKTKSHFSIGDLPVEARCVRRLAGLGFVKCM